MTAGITAAVFANQEDLDDLRAITSATEGHPEGSCVVVVRPDDTPWGASWPGLALVAGRRSVLLPVVGPWPLGFGSSALIEDLERIRPADLIPALRSLRTQIRLDGDIDSSFSIAGESMERIARIALAHIDRSDEDLMRMIFPGSGTASCEVGMEDDGRPIVWVETSSDMFRIHMPDMTREGIMIEEPMLATAHRKGGFAIEGLDQETIVISPMNNDEQGTSLEMEMPTPMEVLRIMARWSRPEGDEA